MSKTLNYARSNSLSLKYQKFTSSGYKDIGIRNFEFVAQTQFLYFILISVLRALRTPLSRTKHLHYKVDRRVLVEDLNCSHHFHILHIHSYSTYMYPLFYNNQRKTCLRDNTGWTTMYLIVGDILYTKYKGKLYTENNISICW